jgi:SAM-dependent methyltransferase
LQLRVGGASEIPNLGRFDYILAIGVLCYMLGAAQRRFVSDAAECCSPGGHLVFDFWNKTYWRKSNSVVPSDLSMDDATRWVEDSGFSVIAASSSDVLDGLPSLWLRCELENVLQVCGALKSARVARRFGHRVTIVARKN